MNILLLSHSTGVVGPIDFLEDYCLKKKYNVIKVQHPLDTYGKKQSFLSENKKIVQVKKRSELGIANLLLDFFISLKFIPSRSVDICFAANNFDTAIAILARQIFKKKIGKIIYFASDFSEERFHNRVFDTYYLKVEKFALHHADMIISNTRRAEEKRIQLGLHKRKSMVLPNGVSLKDKKFEKKTINTHAFIFVGNVTKEHGLLDMLTILKSYINKLVVIGQGEEWDALTAFLKESGINAELHFLKSHDFVIDYLQKFTGFGLAPYNAQSRWTYYCSPLKVNEYIACGVPVLISDVPEINQVIREKKLGVVYKKNELGQIEKALEIFTTNDFNKKAEAFYTDYNYEHLYAKLFKKIGE